jgi:hypothetical protein
MTAPLQRTASLSVPFAQPLLRRAGIGVGFDFVPLLFDYPAQLALHGLEGVVDHFGERLVRTVVHPSFVGDQFVARRHGDIDPDPVRISLLMGVVRLLDGDVATVDVIAEFFQARCFLEHDLVDGVGFVDAPVSDVDG